MRPTRPILGFCFAWLLVLPLLGCGGGKTVKVEGKLTKGVQAFTMGGGETVHMSFTGKGPKGDDAVYSAEVNAAEGTFVVKEIPPGKYKITFNVATGGTDPASLAKQAAFNKQFSLVDGKEYEVPADPQYISIDTATGTITAGSAPK
jgi:hypothetical protein